MDEVLRDFFAAGRAKLVKDTSITLRKECPDYCDRLGSDVLPEACLEPFVHACFHQDTPFRLEQFLFGYIPVERRPECLTVRTDERGRTYVPRLGIFDTGRPEQSLRLFFEPGSNAPLVLAEGASGRVAPAAIPTAGGDGLGIFPHEHPLFQSIIDRERPDERTEIARAVAQARPVLEKALELMAKVSPAAYGDVLDVSRLLVLLENESVYSFATEMAPGALFLSVDREPTELGLCEDLIHQAAHNTFFCVLAPVRDCFTIRATTRLSEFTVLDDQRSLCSALHGLYTLARIDEFFDDCFERASLTSLQRHELAGRLALTMDRFRRTLEAIGDDRLYTPKGRVILEYLRRCYERLSRDRATVLSRADISNQPYVFSYARFCEANPLVATSEATAGRA